MHGIRALTVVALAGAVTGASQQGHIVEHVRAPVVAPRGDCTDPPKLCTDPVLLRGHETTLTYLCLETEGPSTVTVTTTRTTTVTADLTSSVPAMATSISDSRASVIEEPTTTTTVMSTAQVTITRLVTKVTANPPSSPPPPPTITWSFTAVLPTDVKPSEVPRKSLSTPPDMVSPPLSSVSAATSSANSSLGLFPSHTVNNSSSMAFTSSVATLPLVGIHRPVYWNHTGIHAIVNLPTVNLARGAEAKSTETVTTTAAVATESRKGHAGDTQASFIALFFGVLAATLLI